MSLDFDADATPCQSSPKPAQPDRSRVVSVWYTGITPVPLDDHFCTDSERPTCRRARVSLRDRSAGILSTPVSRGMYLRMDLCLLDLPELAMDRTHFTNSMDHDMDRHRKPKSMQPDLDSNLLGTGSGSTPEGHSLACAIWS